MTGRAAGMSGHTGSMTTPATPRPPGRAGGYNGTTSCTPAGWQCRRADASTTASAPIAGAHCRRKLLKEVSHAS